MDYPASKDELVKHAQGKNADDDELSAPKNLPNKKYGTPAAVNNEVSQAAESAWVDPE